MKHLFLPFLFILLLSSFNVPHNKKIKVFLAGDSTISIKEPKAYPETGWGMPFAYFFDSTVSVENHARNGRSTKTFISEGLWQNLIKEVKEDDFVFIQFGHNDEAKDKVDRYTTPEEYAANLKKFVLETRARKANPVLLTPVARRRFKDGKTVPTHEIYSRLVKDIAHSLQVPLIDLDEKSRQLYDSLGEETSKLLFLQLKEGEHPNYPNGKTDNTHFNELGARLVAQIVLSEIKSLNLQLVDRIVKPAVKK